MLNLARLLRRPQTSEVALPPRWHFGMLNDSERNEAFYAALRSQAAPRPRAPAPPRPARAPALSGGGGAAGQVRAGDHVLDIGAGTGLLGMMAARAGAGRVTCCEKAALLARAAGEIVAANGLAGAVRVVPKLSSALSLGPPPPEGAAHAGEAGGGADMAGRADVLVAEIVDCGLLGEGWIPALLDARARLLVPQPRIIPSAAQAGPHPRLPSARPARQAAAAP